MAVYAEQSTILNILRGLRMGQWRSSISASQICSNRQQIQNKETRRTSKTCSLLNKLSNWDTEHYPWHPICPSVTLLVLERWGIDQTVCPSDSVQFKAALLSQEGRNSGRSNHRSPPNVPVANNDIGQVFEGSKGREERHGTRRKRYLSPVD